MKLLTISILAGAIAALPAMQLAPPAQGFDYKWATTQGGLLIALLVVLWSYRRDIMRKFGLENTRLAEERAALTTLVTHSTTALEKNAVELARMNDSNHRLARAVEAIETRNLRP